MASITIRNLDEAAKQALRERAARNGRSMEEEARILLGVMTGRDGEGPGAGQLQSGSGSGAVIPAGHVSTNGAISWRHGALAGKTILLVITGGIASYKALDLIRRLRERGAVTKVIMTRGASQFITPLSASALSGEQTYIELFDRISEHDVGHIRLARECDLVIVAPATADFMARMAQGRADDLASAVLLATRKPVLLAPAMNPAMWDNPATRRNIATLTDDGKHLVGPGRGEMAESGESGVGRMAEPLEIVATAARLCDTRPKPLKGHTAIVTSGPTHEPIDPVRYIANRSSGKQGHAIAAALADAGASVTLVSGPVTLDDPQGVATLHVETAREMQAAVESALPADIAVMVAAVADWRTLSSADEKMKKTEGKGPPTLQLAENPDILKGVGHHASRPRLVIGFAAETHDIDKHAVGKLERKRADWIVANDVSAGTGVMGGDRNMIRLVTRNGIENWPQLDKSEVAQRLVERIAEWFAANTADI
ncbi:MAG: bifunctional phosphopantothenoylcysteine decarboxylase/phosphopantothenate--cysteine ligase CoaBC [Nitratireductor sp.]|nr:bifunctional phosphopantothenoylcysteine decarboxylase/phosphopantothenate--cysteine ligase CoaBC [Nitratireductor sp.]